MKQSNLLTVMVLGFLCSVGKSDILLLSAGDELWTLDATNGTLALLGTLPVGGESILELAQASDGSLFGVAGGNLYSIDPFSVNAVAIGQLDTLGTVAGLAFGPGDTLYGLQWNNHFYEIEPATAAVSYLGQVAVPGPIHTMDADSFGTLVSPTYLPFEQDSFWHIDPDNVESDWVADAPGEISAMVFGTNNVLYAYSDTSLTLYQVDLSSQTWSELWVLDGLEGVEGMELIPEPAVLTMLALASVLSCRDLIPRGHAH